MRRSCVLHSQKSLRKIQEIIRMQFIGNLICLAETETAGLSTAFTSAMHQIVCQVWILLKAIFIIPICAVWRGEEIAEHLTLIKEYHYNYNLIPPPLFKNKRTQHKTTPFYTFDTFLLWLNSIYKCATTKPLNIKSVFTEPYTRVPK